MSTFDSEDNRPAELHLGRYLCAERKSAKDLPEPLRVNNTLSLHTALLMYNGSVKGKLSGGEYAYGEIRNVLKSNFKVREIILEDLVPRTRPMVRRVVKRLFLALLVLFSYFLYGRYDLVVTTWTPEVPFCGDVSYIQPFASKSQTLFGDTGARTDFVELFGKRALALLMRLLRSVSLSRQTFIANSTFCKELIEKELGKRAYLIYPPVPIERFASLETKKNIVLTIGRVSLEKNFQAIVNIGPRVPEAKFVLLGPLGSGGERTVHSIRKSFANEGLDDHFEYLGWVSEETKNQLLRSAKVLFHPTRNEFFGIAIVEGMNHGAIPIVHNSGAPREYVPQKYLFEEDDEAVRKIKDALVEWSPSDAIRLHELSLRFNVTNFRKELSEVLYEAVARKAALLRPSRFKA